MKRLQVDYPDTLPDVLQLTPREFEFEAKMAMVSKLFEMGRISSGTAAEMVGIPRVAFLLQLSRFGVNMMNYEASELETDVDF